MSLYKFDKHLKAIIPVLFFGIGVFLLAIITQWFAMISQNPEQALKDMGENYLEQTILVFAVVLGIGLYLIYSYGNALYKRGIQK